MSESTATSVAEAPAVPAKRKRRWKRWIVSVFLVLFVSVNLIAFLHARAMTHMVPMGDKTSSPQALSAWGKIRVLATGVTVPRPVNRYLPNQPFTTHHFQTRDGETLEAWLIRVPESRGLVVMFHGYSVSKSVLLPASSGIRTAGFDTLLVDFRGSGGSTGNVTTIGQKEALDVAAAIEFARSSDIGASRIVAYGDSMGAAAIIHAIAKEHVALDAVILEQPYSTLYNTVKTRFRSMGIPSFPLAGMLIFWGGVQHGFWAFDLRPIDYARDIRCPTLYLRGQGDPWISMEESQSIYDALTCSKELITIQTDRHDSLRPRDPETWDAGVREFLTHLK